MTLEGIDISHWQTGLNVATAGPDFAIMKATDGTSMVDSECDRFTQQAWKAGILTGWYHFAHTGSDAEADHFVESVRGYLGKGILVLDWEADAVARGPSAAKNWLDRVYAKTGIRPLIYMSQSVATSWNWGAVAKDYALWVARYGSSSYGPTGAWSAPAMWQYTSSGRVNGYGGNVDKNHFYGTADTWRAFATGDAADTTTDDDHTSSGDDMPTYNHKWNTHEFTVPADGEWHTINISDDDEGSKQNLISGHKATFGADLFLNLKQADGREVNVRWIQVDTKSGSPAKTGPTGPVVQHSTRAGWNQLGYHAAGQMVLPGSGYSRHLRFQVRGYTPGDAKAETMTISKVDARALVWE